MTITVGITGRKRAGKNTVAAELAEALREEGLSVEIFAFADPLRRVLLDLNPVVSDGGVRVAELIDTFGWEGVKSTAGGPEVRRLLQCLGTDVLRTLDEQVWVRVMTRRVSKTPADVVIIPDVRFDNEAEFTDMNAEVIRPDATMPDGHASEAGVSAELVDLMLVNDSSVEALRSAVRELLVPMVLGAMMLEALVAGI